MCPYGHLPAGSAILANVQREIIHWIWGATFLTCFKSDNRLTIERAATPLFVFAAGPNECRKIVSVVLFSGAPNIRGARNQELRETRQILNPSVNPLKSRRF